MTIDELLKKLPSQIGRNPIYNEGEIIGYATDENEGCDIGWLYLHNDGKSWYAYYGDGNECVTLNPLDDPPYNNALFYGDTPQEALQELYNWCIKDIFVKGGDK